MKQLAYSIGLFLALSTIVGAASAGTYHTILTSCGSHGDGRDYKEETYYDADDDGYFDYAVSVDCWGHVRTFTPVYTGTEWDVDNIATANLYAAEGMVPIADSIRVTSQSGLDFKIEGYQQGMAGWVHVYTIEADGYADVQITCCSMKPIHGSADNKGNFVQLRTVTYANNRLSFELNSEGRSEVEFSIFDLLGNQVAGEVLTTALGVSTFERSITLPTGAYFVRLSTTTGVQTSKIVVTD